MKPKGTKLNLFGCTKQELVDLALKQGQPAFRGSQVFQWIYQKRVTAISEMSNLPLAWRDQLESECVIKMPTISRRHVSQDESIKYIFNLDDGSEVEAVYMKMTKGVTLCLSSQVGCAQDCSFCLTASMGFIRNLSCGEMVGQVFAIAQDIDLPVPFNVVMMGMGEPLLNLKNLQRMLKVLTDEHCFSLSPKRITVSTSGHARNLQKLAESEIVPRLAISLNATTDEQRDALMPVNLKWNIKELLEICRHLPLKPRERLTFEYVMIRDLNDSDADAKRLIRLVRGIRCKINLIPFNETPELNYQQSLLERIEAFHQILNQARVTNTVRWSKGRDIGAACGQLARPTSEPGAHILAV